MDRWFFDNENTTNKKKYSNNSIAKRIYVYWIIPAENKQKTFLENHKTKIYLYI